MHDLVAAPPPHGNSVPLHSPPHTLTSLRPPFFPSPLHSFSDIVFVSLLGDIRFTPIYPNYSGGGAAAGGINTFWWRIIRRGRGLNKITQCFGEGLHNGPTLLRLQVQSMAWFQLDQALLPLCRRGRRPSCQLRLTLCRSRLVLLVLKVCFWKNFGSSAFFSKNVIQAKNTAILLSGSYRCWHKQCDVSLQSNVRTFVLFFIWWVRRISCCRRWRRWGVFLCTHSDSGSLTLFFCSSSSFFYKFEFQGNCTLRELGIALVGGSSTQDRSANGIFIGNVEPGGRIARAAPSICKGFKIVGRY